MGKNKDNVWILTVLLPILVMFVAFLLFLSIKDNISIHFFEESYLLDRYLSYMIYILIFISLLFSLILLIIKINKKETIDYSVSDWLHEIFVFVIRFFVIGLIFYYPVRGCFLIGNRTFGKQTKVQVVGQVVDYKHVLRKGGYDNNVFIHDPNFDRIINLRVNDNTSFHKGDSITLEMMQGSLGILYRKY